MCGWCSYLQHLDAFLFRWCVPMGTLRRDIDKISLTFRNIQSFSLMNDGVVFMRWLTAYLIFSRMSNINVILSWIENEYSFEQVPINWYLSTISNMNVAVGFVISSASHRVFSHDIQVSRIWILMKNDVVDYDQYHHLLLSWGYSWGLYHPSRSSKLMVHEQNPQLQICRRLVS